MKMPSLALAAAVLAAAPSVWLPTKGILRTVEAWPFLAPAEKEMAQTAQQDLDQGRFSEALAKNEALIASSPAEIFQSPPALPVIEIVPAGQEPPRVPPRAVDGWQWRLETAWVAVCARDYSGAARRFSYLSQAQPFLRGKAAEGEAFARIRQKRFLEASEALRAAGLLTEPRQRLLALARSGQAADWARIDQIAQGYTEGEAQKAAPASPTLAGQIGGSPLPGIQENSKPLPRSSDEPASPRSVRIEAALILAEAWASPSPKEEGGAAVTKDKTRIARARLYINLVFSLAEAFPHHAQAARALGQDLART